MLLDAEAALLETKAMLLQATKKGIAMKCDALFRYRYRSPSGRIVGACAVAYSLRELLYHYFLTIEEIDALG